jgi:hypothetical protein
MQWKKLSDTSITCGRYIIGRFSVGDGDRFHIAAGAESLGYFDTAAKAKSAAEAHDKQTLAGAMNGGGE